MNNAEIMAVVGSWIMAVVGSITFMQNVIRRSKLSHIYLERGLYPLNGRSSIIFSWACIIVLVWALSSWACTIIISLRPFIGIWLTNNSTKSVRMREYPGDDV